MALKYMRDNLKNLKWVLWFVVFVFIALVFVDWGSGRANGGGDNVALRIGDHVINEQDFLHEMRDSEQRFQSIYGKQWQQIRDKVNLAEQTMQRLVQRQLLVDEAHSAGLVVTPDELQEKILSFPAFRRQNGSFVGAAMYERILRANQTTPQRFESTLRQDLLIDKLRSVLAGGIVVSDQTVRDSIEKERESADFEAIPVRFEHFLDQSKATDADIEAYYKEHADDFKRDEQRVIRYLVVETNKLRRTLPVSDDEIASYYNEHKSEFMEPEQAHARHILFRVPPTANAAQKAEIKLRADAVAKMARQGADFAELAKKHSEDPASAENGGDLGWFARGRMVKEFEDAVFGHKPGDIVGPVQSQFGWHIIKVEGFKPARQRPLDEVREEVRFRLLEGRAAAEAESRAATLARSVKENPPTTEAAWQALADKDEAVDLNVSPPFSDGAVIPGVGDNKELATAVFKANVNDVGGPVAVPRGFIVWQLAEIKPAGVPPLAEIKDDVTAQVKRTQALAAAHKAAEALAASWRAGGDAKALAKEAGANLVPVAQHKRSTAVPGLGLSMALDEAVFGATTGAVVGPVPLAERGWVVAKVTKLDTVPPEELAKDMGAARSRMVNERVDDLLTSILNQRRREIVIVPNTKLIDRYAPKAQSS